LHGTLEKPQAITCRFSKVGTVGNLSTNRKKGIKIKNKMAQTLPVEKL
jgi:hypothetical protein